MEKPVLTNKDQFPDEDIIYASIAKKKDVWQALFRELHQSFPEFEEQWRYYNDGKSWLLKIVKRSKTIMWVAVFRGYFKTTFYFGDKAETKIMESPISPSLKDQYTHGKRYGKIRAITVTPGSNDDIAEVLSLASLKLSLK